MLTESSKLENLRKISNCHTKALRNLHNTVDFTRDEVIDEALSICNEGKIPYLVGIKNTSAIPIFFTQKMKRSGFLFHTLDKTHEKGRAVYTSLVNPLNARPMTGSSASSVVNILRGINQLAIGTDGGGSVLAPAISTNLYSVMGKGMGLMGETNRVSTDGINFVPGIGVIGEDFDAVVSLVHALLDSECSASADLTHKKSDRQDNIYTQKIKVIAVKWNDEEVDFGFIESEFVELKIVKLEKMYDRNSLIEVYRDLMSQADFVVSYERSVDIDGIGDSVLGSFGSTGKEIQKKGGKYFLKVANMMNITAVSMPDKELSSGFLFMCKEGMSEGLRLMEFCRQFKDLLSRPKLYDEYFFENTINAGFIR